MPKTQLTDLQLDVVRVLWERGEATVAEVRDAIASDRDLATTTVATILNRLERAGAIDRRDDVRPHVYRPRVTEREVKRSMVADLVGSLFGGDPAALVTHLVREEEIGTADLERLRDALRDAEGEADDVDG